MIVATLVLGGLQHKLTVSMTRAIYFAWKLDWIDLILGKNSYQYRNV
jgi:hypothetical protein